MKTLRNLMLAVIVLTAFSISTQAQWAFNSADIYNINNGNVGIGITSPPELFTVHNATDWAKIQVERSMLTGTGNCAAVYAKNSATGHLYYFGLKKMAVGHNAVQSVYDATTSTWRTFSVVNSSTGKYEIRGGIVDAEYKNTGDVLFNNPGGVAVGTIPDGHGLNVLNYISGKAAVQGLNEGVLTYAVGMLGVLSPGILGAPLSVTNVGVLGIKPANGGDGAAVYGWNNDNNGQNYAGLFFSDGAATTTDYTNYGVYANAQKANLNIAGQFYGRVDIQGHPDAATAADYLLSPLVVKTNHTQSNDSPAIEAESTPTDGYGVGVKGTGGYMGVRGIAISGAYAGYAYGVYGSASSGTAGTHIGLYGTASGGTTNWAGYFSGDAYISSDLRIGTTTQALGYSLSVNGKIACEEVLVKDDSNWPDYVFAEGYDLMSLKQLEKSIEKNNHLPGLPAASEVEENGFELADMQRRVLEKVEELTLYTIEQGKLIEELQNKVGKLEKENSKLKKAIK